MKFTSAISLVLATLLFMVSAAATDADAAACRAFCCDALVPGIRPAGNVGINCTPGGLDCAFGGQITACCVRLGSLGATRGTAIGCQ